MNGTINEIFTGSISGSAELFRQYQDVLDRDEIRNFIFPTRYVDYSDRQAEWISQPGYLSGDGVYPAIRPAR